MGHWTRHRAACKKLTPFVGGWWTTSGLSATWWHPLWRRPIRWGLRQRQGVRRITSFLGWPLKDSPAGGTYGRRQSTASLHTGGGSDAVDDLGDPSIHAGLILGVADGPDGELVATRQILAIEDHDTGLGAGLVHQLAITDTEAEKVLAAGAPGEVIDIGSARVVLRMASPSTVQVDLTMSPITGEATTHLWPTSDLPDRLLGVLTRARLDQNTSRPRLHGGALVNADGHAVLLLGPSNAGKSTLAAHLAAAGLQVLNDEQVTLYAGAGLAAGFTRPIALERPGVDHLPAGVETAMAADQRAMLLPTAALGSVHRLTGRPALVALPTRNAGEDGVSWEQVNPQEALEELCANNLDLVTRPSEGLKAFAWLVTSAPMVRLRYRDAADAVSPLLHLLSEPPTIPAISWSVDQETKQSEGTGPAAGSVGAGQGSEPELGIRRREGLVTVHMGEEAVVFDPSSRHVARLNAAATMVWDSLPLPLQADGFVATAPEELEAFLDELFELGFVEADDRLDEAGPGTGREASAVTGPPVGGQPSGRP